MSEFLLGGVWDHARHSPHLPQSDARADSAKRAAEAVDSRLERALLTMEAMWTLLRDKLGVTEQELADRIVEIDMTDGVLDGKVRRPPLTCQACNRTIPRRLARCMYCTADVQHDPFS